MATADDVLAGLRSAGQHPSQELLDRVKEQAPDIVPRLIEMATDDDLHYADSESPEVWAPIHAIRLLGQFEAPEAVEPLLPYFARQDDDYLIEQLQETFGRIGKPALGAMEEMLFQRSSDEWPRISAAVTLRRMAEFHQELRDEVVTILSAALDPSESQTPEDETVAAFAISELLSLKAVEAAPVIQQAFDEDRVDCSVVDRYSVEQELGVSIGAAEEQEQEGPGKPLWLRCTACGFTRNYRVERAYYNLDASRPGSEGSRAITIADRISCSKCGAVDQYELTPLSQMAVTGEMLRAVAADRQGKRAKNGSDWLVVRGSAPSASAATQIAPRSQRKIGRNDPCPCGSGKKYKKCCGR